MNKSKYAIIVPSYNCEPYVEATLGSLMAQGEALKRCDCVILTDDCSKDRTIEVAKATWDGRIPLIVFEATQNRGEYRNMNECIDRLPAHIEWYLVMHADNMAKAGWLEALLDRADKVDARVATICTSWDNLDENGITEGENRQPPTIERIHGNESSIVGTIQRGCWWHISSCVTRVRTYREIGGLPLGLRLKGDWDFLLRMMTAYWHVEYIPRALMTYRVNPTGSSSLSFRRHRDIYETLIVLSWHHMAMNVLQVAAEHGQYLKILARRATGGIILGHWERALATAPASWFVIKSLAACLWEHWQGRRRFNWVSSTDLQAESRLDFLSTEMLKFYSTPGTREAYQAMIDAETSAQPLIEGELRKALLASKPEMVLEVGCGSGRIYQSLRQQGLKAQYTGVEVSPEVIERNRMRFPEAKWKTGSGYDLQVEAESHDCVFAYYVLEHCAYPQRFLASLMKAVKPGGRLLLTFPDIIESEIFGSQALGWDNRTAKEHLKAARIFHALVRLWDTRVRLPISLAKARRTIGQFPINLSPQCLEPGCKMEPDVDAIYIASRGEVEAWARSQGYQVDYPAGEKGQLRLNVLIQISKAAML
jgi:2-polyprenyl-3-methyl-5-hydroxy-6-metoxy-1,4-benzoquinol methylase/glycosyltransferase involved in cell wall biosynthesis